MLGNKTRYINEILGREKSCPYDFCSKEHEMLCYDENYIHCPLYQDISKVINNPLEEKLENEK